MGGEGWVRVHMALVPRCPLVAKDVMRSAEHHHVGEVVTKAQEPEAHHVPPKGALPVQQRGPRFRGRLLPLAVREAPPRARAASHGFAFRVREGPGPAAARRRRVFKSSGEFGAEGPRVGGSRDSARGAPHHVLGGHTPRNFRVRALSRLRALPASGRGPDRGREDPGTAALAQRQTCLAPQAAVGLLPASRMLRPEDSRASDSDSDSVISSGLSSSRWSSSILSFLH